MAIIYCSKSGSDSNNGSTYVLSKLTIQASITAAGAGGTVIVGSGWYNELLTVTLGSITMYADGNVVLDGQGLSGSGMIYLTGAVSNGSISVLPYTTGGTWMFQNNPSTIFINQNNWSSTTTINFTNCIFLGSPTPYWFTNGGSGQAGGNPFAGLIKNCVFSNFSNKAINLITYATSANLTVTQCTFYNCVTALNYSYYNTPAAFLGTIAQNIFSNCTTAISMVPAMTTAAILNNNDYYSCTHLLNNNGSNYDTLSAVQALGFESAGMTTNPQLLDPTHNIFYTGVNLNPLMQIGAYAYGKNTGSSKALASTDTTWSVITSLDSPAQSGTGWYNADGNITQDPTTKDLILSSGTSGIVVSPVYNLGSAQAITNINLGLTEIWATAGIASGAMIDTTASDVRPNYQTVEMRYSGSAFNQGDVSPSWAEYKYELSFTPVAAQYIQLRVTMRNNDAGA